MSGGGVLVRREVGGLGSDQQQWDPITEAYALAVRTMRARSANDPTSWDYQAAIHGRAGPTQLPLYNQCQHATWYFLPWHRMYLYWFERIVRAAVVANGGPPDWTLPFWDYGRPGQAKALPWVFRTPTLPDGSSNPLLVTQRGPGRNGGAPLPAAATDASAAMRETVFTRPTGTLGFGGPRTGWAHFGSGFGALENQPHNVVHVQVGGWMSNPDTAAQDPVFWLHHANIDRLWELWNRRGGPNTNDNAWLGQTFELFDENGQRVSMDDRDVVDIEGQLKYTYEGLPAHPAAVAAAPSPEGGPRIMSEDLPTELVGATPEPLRLGARAESVAFPIAQPTTLRALEGAVETPPRVYLSVENVTGDRAPSTSYEVVLDMGDNPPGEELVAGVVACFGLEQASTDTQGEGPHGLRFTFDITHLVERLQAQGAWGEGVRVVFRPMDDLAEDEATEISVGRVGVYYE